MNKIINLFFSMLCSIALIGCVTHSHDHGHDHDEVDLDAKKRMRNMDLQKVLEKSSQNLQ